MIIPTPLQLASSELMARLQEQDPRNVVPRGRPRLQNSASQASQNSQNPEPNRHQNASTRRILSHDEAPARGGRGGRGNRAQGTSIRGRISARGSVQRPATRGNNTQRRRGGGSSRGATAQIARQVEEIQGNMTGMQNTVANLEGMLRQFLQNQHQQ